MNKATLDLIKSFESLHDGDLSKVGLQPKLDPIGIWTEGYGRAMIDPRTKKFLTGAINKKYAESIATITTEEEAINALNEDLIKYSTAAKNALTEPLWNRLNDNQKGALTSFVYNCGTGNPPYRIFPNIRLYLDCKNSKELLYEYWCDSIIRAKKNGVMVVLEGLKRRRKAEADLFFKPI